MWPKRLANRNHRQVKSEDAGEIGLKSGVVLGVLARNVALNAKMSKKIESSSIIFWRKDDLRLLRRVGYGLQVLYVLDLSAKWDFNLGDA